MQIIMVVLYKFGLNHDQASASSVSYCFHLPDFNSVFKNMDFKSFEESNIISTFINFVYEEEF